MSTSIHRDRAEAKEKLLMAEGRLAALSAARDLMNALDNMGHDPRLTVADREVVMAVKTNDAHFALGDAVLEVETEIAALTAEVAKAAAAIAVWAA